jgi:hypothetical protein
MLFSAEFLRQMFADDRGLIEDVEVGRDEELTTYHRVFVYGTRHYRVTYSLLGSSRDPIFNTDSLQQCECVEVKRVFKSSWEPI